MRLTAKILLILTSVLSLLGLLSILFFFTFIIPSFLAIEEKAALADIQRVVYSIQNEMAHLSTLNNDWAAWDDSYEFIETHSDEYIQNNLILTAFTINSLNIIHYYNVNGELVWGEARDLNTGELISIKKFSDDRLPTDHLLLKFAPDKGSLSNVGIKGLCMTEHGPMLISSEPILNSEGEGPARGTLIMGRFLDNSLIEKLTQQIKVNFNVFDIRSDSLPESLQNTLQTLGPEKYYLDKSSVAQLKIYASFPDLAGAQGVLIQADKKRAIFKESRVVMKYTIFSIALSIFTSFVVLYCLLQKNVLGPIYSLTHHVLEIGNTGNLASQLKVNSNDEVGILAREFNYMITKLHEAKHKLQEQSFQLGMSELASGILHNIRNSLHKMFSSSEELRRTIDTLPVEKITLARQELSTTVESEKRKADLVDFLDKAYTSLLLFITTVKEQLDANEPVVAEMENVLKSFEKWAFGEKTVEQVQIVPIINDSYHFLERSYRDPITLHVAPEVNEVGYLAANRIILIQVFINLFTNAIESINRLEGVRGEIRIEAEVRDMDAGEAVHLRVYDNGAGMDKDVLKSVFTRGFSTKSTENTGLGLHWCANAVESMNGKLYAESKGSGQGACFHLVLPRNID